MSDDDDAMDAMVTRMRWAADQYSVGLRDLKDEDPELAQLARVLAKMIKAQCPDADGNAIIASALAVWGACTLMEESGNQVNARGAVNLMAVAGRTLIEQQQEGNSD
jgi:hypothetical protein